MSDEIKDLKAEERAPTDDDRRGGNTSWVPGLVLIGIGLVFLLNNFTDFELHNWWALFILIPAFASLGNFLRAYRQHGRMTDEARGSFIGMLILFFVAAVFLFGWSWGAVWPFFLIIAGVGALLSGLLD